MSTIDAERQTDAGFLGAPEASPDVQHIYDEDVERVGYVMNLSKLWAHQPALQGDLSAVIGHASDAGSLSFRQRAILVAACASTLGDAYCSLSWGKRLAA